MTYIKKIAQIVSGLTPVSLAERWLKECTRMCLFQTEGVQAAFQMAELLSHGGDGGKDE